MMVKVITLPYLAGPLPYSKACLIKKSRFTNMQDLRGRGQSPFPSLQEKPHGKTRWEGNRRATLVLVTHCNHSCNISRTFVSAKRKGKKKDFHCIEKRNNRKNNLCDIVPRERGGRSRSSRSSSLSSPLCRFIENISHFAWRGWQGHCDYLGQEKIRTGLPDRKMTELFYNAVSKVWWLKKSNLPYKYKDWRTMGGRQVNGWMLLC